MYIIVTQLHVNESSFGKRGRYARHLVTHCAGWQITEVNVRYFFLPNHHAMFCRGWQITEVNVRYFFLTNHHALFLFTRTTQKYICLFGRRSQSVSFGIHAFLQEDKPYTPYFVTAVLHNAAFFTTLRKRTAHAFANQSFYNLHGEQTVRNVLFLADLGDHN